MENTSTTISIDSKLINEASAVFSSLGIDMSTAVNRLLRNAIANHEILLCNASENPVILEPKDRRGAFGCLKGKIHVPEDFNDPLDDFQEYIV